MSLSVLPKQTREYFGPRDRFSWLFPFFVFSLTQVIAAGAFNSVSSGRYLEFVARWDGGFYTEIARNGYPSDTTGSAAGEFTEGIWAFYPLYPLIVRLLASLSPLEVPSMAPLVSLTAGALPVGKLFRTVEYHVGRPAAVSAVVLVCTWMSAPVMQMAYTESLALLLLVWAFDLLLRGRYVLLLPVMLLLSLTRPLIFPFAFVVGFHAIRVWSKRSVKREDNGKLLSVLVACPFLAALWPIVGAVVTGRPTAYFDAMSAFGVPGVARSWIVWGVSGGLTGVLVVLSAFGVLSWVAIKALPSTSPAEFRVWATIYPTYILVGSYVWGSLARYLLLNFPAALILSGCVNGPRSRMIVLGSAAVFGSVLGVLWVQQFVGGGTGPIP